MWAMRLSSILLATIQQSCRTWAELHVEIVNNQPTRGASRSQSKEVLKGISYGPMPAKTGAPVPKADDFMGDGSRFMWGPDGRNDLGIMQKMGANAVRLYGNDPRMDHKGFLDRAHDLGIEVIMGLSDYPYIQMPNNCQSTGFDCFNNITDQYSQILSKGVLQDGQYHPAVKKFILINEPDLKFGSTDVQNYLRVIVSAFDAVLHVEQQSGAHGNLPFFTTTFSYATCTRCKSKYKGKPALPNMDDLMAAMKNPSSIDYKPRTNDLFSSYQKRFINSFNTANLADDIQSQFLQYYVEVFPNTPTFIGEYHHARPGTNQFDDLQKIVKICEDGSNPLIGFSFFEWQVRYDKGGSEMAFGMYGLGDLSFGSVLELGDPFPSWCLTPVIDDLKENLPEALTKAFGGKGVDQSKLCDANPLGVILNEEGFKEIQALKNTDSMATFIQRIVEHMGGNVVDSQGLKSFAGLYSGQDSKPASFNVMMNQVVNDDHFARFDDGAECATDPNTPDIFIGGGIGPACGELGEKKLFNCSNVPDYCSGDVRSKADYIFSVYYRQAANGTNPLVNCAFGIAGKFQIDFNKKCTVSSDPVSTPLTAEGYQRILPQSAGHMQDFIARYIISQNGKVTDKDKGLQQLSKVPPATFKDLQHAVATAPWACGQGFVETTCPGNAEAPTGPDLPTSPSSSSSLWWVWLLVICLVLAIVGGGLFFWKTWIKRRRQPLLQNQQQNTLV